MKLLAEPMMAKIHIQKTAPGPPTMMALATPAMLPTPTRAPNPIQKASKDETVWLCLPSFVPESARREVLWILRIGRPFSLIMKYMPRPTRNTNATYHT